MIKKLGVFEALAHAPGFVLICVLSNPYCYALPETFFLLAPRLFLSSPQLVVYPFFPKSSCHSFNAHTLVYIIIPSSRYSEIMTSLYSVHP